MQNSNYAIIITEQLGFTYSYHAKRDCIFAQEISKIRITFLKVLYTDKCNFKQSDHINKQNMPL